MGKAYTNIDDEKDMSDSPWQEPTIGNEIINLISELCHDSQGVFEKCHDNQKPSKGRQVSDSRIRQTSWEEKERESVRLDGVHHVFQNIFEFGRVLLDLIKGTGIRGLRGIGRLDPGVWIWLVHVGKLSALLLAEHDSQRYRRSLKVCKI